MRRALTWRGTGFPLTVSKCRKPDYDRRRTNLEIPDRTTMEPVDGQTDGSVDVENSIHGTRD